MQAGMALTAGARLGPYEIISLLGEGGMGQVYRARDTLLGRDVAIKVLPDAFAADPDRLMRFEREAKTLATLNHTNIAQIHGLEQTGSTRGLVMELVDGPTLADRIAQGPVPLDEALGIAREITAALDAAHTQGIVHRDLKPANVKLALDGTVKVLDFGLAKAIQTADVSRQPSDAMAYSPTITSPAVTQAGVILGTAAYMAPEQARGRTVDKRADIWAFGCLLYEMLTGARAFAGDSLTDTFASIVKDQPNLDRAPASVRRLLARCLEKDPRKRLRDIADAFDLIDEPRAPIEMPGRPAWRAWIPWAIAGLAIATLAALIVFRAIATPAPAPVVKFQVAWPGKVGGTLPRFFEISPDGRYFAMASDGLLWVRGLDDLEATRLEHTEGATYPFWSPDSSFIGFFAGDKLKKVSRSGGPVQLICDVPVLGRGAAWSPNGTIVFSGHGEDGIARVSEDGGVATQVTKPRGENDLHRYAQFLPDGERFLFLNISSNAKESGVYVGALDGRAPVRVLEGQDAAQLVPPARTGGLARLLFVRRGSLMSQPFDMNALRVTGDAAVVATPVGLAENSGQARFTFSRAGVLAYSGGQSGNRELVWFDRAGKRLNTVTSPASTGTFAIDRSGRRLAFSVANELGTQQDVWIQASPEGPPSKLTFGPPPGWTLPTWSPAGDAVAFVHTDLAGLPKYEIRVKKLATSEPDDVIVQSKNVLYLWDWSPDGRHLVYSDGDLWQVPLEGAHTPSKLASARQHVQLSRDGRWFASTTFSPRPEVYVEPRPPTGAFWLISNDGGTMPRWRQDGKELFYRGLDGRLRAVPILPSRDGAPLAHGNETILNVTALESSLFSYQPSPDGQRFLMNVSVEHTTPPTNVVLNWRP
jgi:Tol biopolymer transport system component/tRNA A-37 threonylcarbamoyl transferase component Bud32